MNISYVGHAFAIAETVDLPAGCIAYDVAVVHAMRILSGTAPSLPTGWTDIGALNQSSNISQRVGYKVLDGTEENTGTWTNATNVQVNVYRGVNWTTPIGTIGTRSTTSIFTFPAITLAYGDGSAWVVCFAAYNLGNVTSMYAGSIAGHTNRSSGHGMGGYVGAWDKANTATYPESANIPTGGSGSLVAHNVELIVASAAPPETPYVWEIIAGELPDDLLLDSATGEITGIVAADVPDGTYIFTVIAYNNTFATQAWTCQLTVYGTGLPAATWSLDLEKTVSLKVLAWHRHSRVLMRPTIVEGKYVLYVDSDNIAYRLERATIVESGSYWVSPMLNRKKRNSDYTITEVLVRYRASDTTIINVYASGNGGQTWKAPILNFTPLFGADQSIRWVRTHFNVTGSDIRFKIEFYGAIPVWLYEWQAKLIEREGVRKG